MRRRTYEDIATQAVNKIIEDIKDRRVLSDSWYDIEDEIQEEIIEAWTEIIIDEM